MRVDPGAGRAVGAAVLAAAALALAVHLIRVGWRPGSAAAAAGDLWRVGVATQIAVSLAVPAMAVFGAPVPASLGVLPIASDGASFLVTVAGAGLVTGRLRGDGLEGSRPVSVSARNSRRLVV
jgi:hypothetical protein